MNCEQQVDICGQRINYIKVGNGDHYILCYPGALGTIWNDFKPQIENLNRNIFTIVVWDPPGYGYSRPPDKKFTMDFYEDDADIAFEFMKFLGVEKFSLLGWSDGGISSIILAAKHPNNIRKLIVWGATVYMTEDNVEQYEKGNDLCTWSEKMKSACVAVYGEDELIRIWRGLTKVIRSIYEERAGNKCKEKLPMVKCPTLIIHGELDVMITPEHLKHMLTNIKGSVVHRFPEGKHNLHLRYATEFNEVVTKFLEE